MQDIPKPNHIPFNNIPKGTSTSRHVEKLVMFLEKYLPDFVIEKSVNKNQGENDITERLYIYLTRKAKFNPENIEYNYNFQTEKLQKTPKQKGHPRRMDIAARLNTIDNDLDVIYCLEAKKLPTPGNGREKEYISGDGGAIERFKKEVHGMDDFGNLLESNGIIAYVTEHNFEYWLTQINQWITECGWSDADKLAKHYFGDIGKLTSKHLRSSGSPLHLDHFWVIV